MDTSVKSFVNLENARVEEQRRSMERIQARGECPFCEKNLRCEHTKPILKEGRFWILTENEWKYEAAKLHFLLIYRKHAEKLSELDSFAGTEMFGMIKWLENEYQIASGAIGIRFGDMKLNGGTVRHLHVHVIVPYGPEDPLFQVARFRMSAKK